jgi:hypothetical protein
MVYCSTTGGGGCSWASAEVTTSVKGNCPGCRPSAPPRCASTITSDALPGASRPRARILSHRAWMTSTLGAVFMPSNWAMGPGSCMRAGVCASCRLSTQRQGPVPGRVRLNWSLPAGQAAGGAPPLSSRLQATVPSSPGYSPGSSCTVSRSTSAVRGGPWPGAQSASWPCRHSVQWGGSDGVPPPGDAVLNTTRRSVLAFRSSVRYASWISVWWSRGTLSCESSAGNNSQTSSARTPPARTRRRSISASTRRSRSTRERKTSDWCSWSLTWERA